MEPSAEDDFAESIRDLKLNDEPQHDHFWSKWKTKYREYVYHKLASQLKEIRLLHIHASSSSRLPVSCTLEVISLKASTTPHYEAISYCWTEIPGRKNIIVNNAIVRVPASAAKALQQFRKKTGIRTVWLDAVCINQTDLQERNQQVALMGEIFRSTIRTLIWVGEPDDTTEAAFSSINAMATDLWIPQLDNLGSFGKLGDHEKWDIEVEKAKDSGRIDFAAVRSLMQRPWFQRVWVLQEATLAPFSRCYSGTLSVSWREICRAHRFMDRAYENMVDFELPRLGFFIFRQAPALGGPDSFPLGLLLEGARKLRCSDPKDRFYGVLGLTKWSEDKIAVLADMGITIDYSKSLPAVLRDATRATIYLYHNLTSFRFVDEASFEQRTSVEEDCVSWCPRWDLKANKQQCPKAIEIQTFTAATSKRVINYEYYLNFLMQPKCLTLQGYIPDEVASVAPSFGTLIRDMTDDPLANFQTIYLTNSILRTVIDRGDAAELGRIFEVMSTGNISIMFDEAEVSPIIKAFINKASKLWDSASEVVESDNFWFQLGEWTGSTHSSNHRCLFTTTTGKLGLGPPWMQKGDVVGIPFGTIYPFILRPIPADENAAAYMDDSNQRPRYQLVGNSFIAGMMHGEVEEQLEEAGVEPIVFEIW